MGHFLLNELEEPIFSKNINDIKNKSESWQKLTMFWSRLEASLDGKDAGLKCQTEVEPVLQWCERTPLFVGSKH